MTGAVIAALHLLGFGLLLTSPLAAGVGLTAYALGLRHAFDADHIGAIDNVTRRLGRGRRVGLAFALGHSTVVFCAVALLVAGVHWTGVGSAVGPVVSGIFLLVIGLANVALLARRADSVVVRAFGRGLDRVGRPWRMVGVGFLFGLGFDTATEVTLLATASGAVAGGAPPFAVLALPLLFAAGMTLVDTLDGAFMETAFRVGPARRLLTGMSVVLALSVAAIQLTGADEIDLALLGYVVVAAFALAWAVATAARSAGAGSWARSQR